MNSRYRGCLLAGACGDALGYPIEFCSRNAIIQQFGKGGVTEMILHEGKALISDDTQMSIYTAQGLIHAKRGNCNYEQTVMEIYKSYLRWSVHQQGMCLPSGNSVYTEEIHKDDLLSEGKNQELAANRAPGRTCLNSLYSGSFGTRNNKINDSKGCGGVMRVAPIAIAYVNDSNTGYQLACDSSLLTHCHILGYTTSGALILILIRLFHGKTIYDAVVDTIQELKGKSECSSLVPVLEKAVETAMKRVESPQAFKILGEGWVAEETLAIAIWAALMYPNDLKQAIIASINHSGDSDSTGAVCGYIMGAALGEEAIPSSWLRNLELKDLICSQVEEMCTLFGCSSFCFIPVILVSLFYHFIDYVFKVLTSGKGIS